MYNNTSKERGNPMTRKVNMLCAMCVAIAAVAIAAITTAALVGCEPIGGGTRKQNIAAVIQTAYDFGGREAVSNKIESLVAEGKVTPSQAVRLHALAQLAYEGIMDDLAAGGDAATNTAPASTSQGGCTDCSLPDASAGCGECNEDARCDKCADCTDGK